MTMTSLISCFQCSAIQGADNCPQSFDDYNIRRNQAGSYLENTNPADICSILVGNSGRIYHQGGMSYDRCQNTEVSKTMAQQVASRHRDPTAKIQCCSKNGCNWNFTTASTKDGGASIDTGFTEIAADNNTLLSALGFVVLGLVLLLLIFFLCFLLYKRKTKEEDPTETKEERTLFKDEGSQAANLKGMYSQKYAQQYIEMDRASSKNSFGGQYPVSSGSTKISVRPATPDTMADVWKNKSTEKYNKYDLAGHKKDSRVTNIKYLSDVNTSESSTAYDRKYNGVDTDWIDLKSNNYFSNEEAERIKKNLEEEKAKKPQKKPDWRNVITPPEIQEDNKKPQAWFVEF